MDQPSHTSQRPLRIGTRRSKLAIVQTEGIRDSLQKLAPGRTFQIETLHTLGDKDKSTALYSFGEKSLWTAELEEKLTSGELDVVVHCLKGVNIHLPHYGDMANISQICQHHFPIHVIWPLFL